MDSKALPPELANSEAHNNVRCLSQPIDANDEVTESAAQQDQSQLQEVAQSEEGCVAAIDSKALLLEQANLEAHSNTDCPPQPIDANDEVTESVARQDQSQPQEVAQAEEGCVAAIDSKALLREQANSEAPSNVSCPPQPTDANYEVIDSAAQQKDQSQLQEVAQSEEAASQLWTAKHCLLNKPIQRHPAT